MVISISTIIMLSMSMNVKMELFCTEKGPVLLNMISDDGSSVHTDHLKNGWKVKKRRRRVLMCAAQYHKNREHTK